MCEREKEQGRGRGSSEADLAILIRWMGRALIKEVIIEQRRQESEEVM